MKKSVFTNELKMILDSEVHYLDKRKSFWRYKFKNTGVSFETLKRISAHPNVTFVGFSPYKSFGEIDDKYWIVIKVNRAPKTIGTRITQ